MSKNVLLLSLAVIILYIGLFTVSLWKKPLSRRLAEPPAITFPICEDSDLPILLTSSGKTLCQDETSLYIRDQGKKYVVKKINTSDSYFPSSLDFIVFQSDREIVIEKLHGDRSLEEVYTLKIDKSITPISVLFYRNDYKIYLFVSAQKEAHSPKDTKSVIFRVEIATEKTPITLLAYQSVEMLKVVNISSSGTLLFLRELYPFLEEKHKALLWNETPKLLPTTCLSEEKTYSTDNIPSDINNCTNIESNIFAKSGAGSIILDSQNALLKWRQNTLTNETTLVTNITPQEWQLVAKYTTRIAKRVYNCFDFSESLQITLRTCLPEL